MRTEVKETRALQSLQHLNIAALSVLPLLIILLGILFTLSLQIFIQDGVFYSGDGGLKALLTQQLATGAFHFDLNLSAINWVKELWKNGLYPFTPPYVYQRSDQYFITFPFTFPLVTAPFYALFGYRGIYIIPIVSTWLIWFKFYSICQHLQLGGGITSIALIVLIFASPLSLYSGMYWEHTLALALAFYGLANLLVSNLEKQTIEGTIINGILIGLSVWFRPEFLCLVGILLLLVPITRFGIFKQFNPTPGRSIIFTISLLVTIALFFAINKVVYGHPLGIHALQIVEKFSPKDRLLDAFDNFKELTFSLFHFFPILFLLLLFPLLVLLNRKIKLTSQMGLIYLISLLFIIAVPLIVPSGAGGKQWGPRFLLILIPLISLLLAIQLKTIRETMGRQFGYISLGIVCIFLAVGLHLNIYVGLLDLKQHYQAIAPAIQALKENPNSVVAISYQHVAQTLVAPLREKLFFRTETTEDLKKLSAALVHQGYRSFLYICYPHRPCPTPQESPAQLKVSVANQPFEIQFSSLGTSSKYPMYEVSLHPTLGRSLNDNV
jgi:hypothetical protein